MKGAIVTGANGFMGHHLVQTLIDNDYKVYAVIRSEESEVSCIDQLPNVKLVYCDMKNWDSLPEKIDGAQIEYVYHLAWAGSSGDLRKNYELQMENVLSTCFRQKISDSCRNAAESDQRLYRLRQRRNTHVDRGSDLA